MGTKITLFAIFSLDIVGSSSATECYVGRGFNQGVNSLQWLVPVADPCRCTAIRLGGEIITASLAYPPLSRGGDLLLSEDAEEIWTFFNCTARFCAALPGPGDWQYLGHSCYLIIESKLNYQEAEEYCVNLLTKRTPAHLASIHSAEENAFLRRYYAKVYQAPTDNIALWIGYDRVGSLNQYQWVDDGSIGRGFTDWHPGEPSGGSERCAAMWYGQHWNDWSCNVKAPFVCKVPALYRG